MAEIEELQNKFNFLKAELDRVNAALKTQQEENNKSQSILTQARSLFSQSPQ
ncbi:hypothetical protein IscW_ISCW014467 [Ixodes scapularis]|uniref:Uncharacterized protein n=1 Tax=Ixodes scapularis TaxID=6945 RepID=B7QIT7_IXOSC|nr:hypothetical protein IscW_ISCW014467 [Ixodes scapularis]|eukprot:XP_002415094.1 hypothetical protein IscW_ISCW014467 [Ixodes scapularis]